MHVRPLLAAFALMALAAPTYAQSRLPMEGFADLAERLTPAVVNIATSQRIVAGAETPRFPPGSPLERFNQGLAENSQVTSLGSGFIISADGVIVTNNHVIAEADTIEVILQNDQHYPASVVGRDPATDIAVLRVHARGPLPFVRFGDSDTARVGDLVLAIGNPFGLGGSLSVGVVSARNRNLDAGRYDDFIQTDAAINRGNSGGPLFNVSGDVIGMNTAILSPSGGSVGIGFATPTSIIQPVVAQILRYGEIRRGWLGVRLADVNERQWRSARRRRHPHHAKWPRQRRRPSLRRCRAAFRGTAGSQQPGADAHDRRRPNRRLGADRHHPRRPSRHHRRHHSALAREHPNPRGKRRG